MTEESLEWYYANREHANERRKINKQTDRGRELHNAANRRYKEKKKAEIALYDEEQMAAYREETYFAYIARHGVSRERYFAILEIQGGGCAICGTPEWGGKYNRPAIDHDHSCCPGKRSCGLCVRGFLCYPCNMGLGSFVDDIDRLAAAVQYLNSWPAQRGEAVA